MSRQHAIKSSIDKIKKRLDDLPDSKALADLIVGRSIPALAKAITFIESNNISKRTLGLDTLDQCMPQTGDSIRIGITGVPGVGKSTFIEAFGLHLIDKGHKVAVLAIDPSSKQTGGSILGDKTRMEHLSVHMNAFVRPSPAGETLGGVAAKTRESILLCEAAGFDVILVETVGVGQSETMVHSMTDYFLLLMLAGAGDELQGIKRGIMEIADQIVINKADGDNLRAAKNARSAYAHAIHLFPPKQNQWVTPVTIASGLNNEGVDTIWENISHFKTNHAKHIQTLRTNQSSYWFKDALHHALLEQFMANPDIKANIQRLEQEVREGKTSPYSAVKKIRS